jgi:hypothetical protein
LECPAVFDSGAPDESNGRPNFYLPVSLLAIDLAPPPRLRLAAPLRPLEPRLALPALPRSSDFTLLSILLLLCVAMFNV